MDIDPSSSVLFEDMEKPDFSVSEILSMVKSSSLDPPILCRLGISLYSLIPFSLRCSTLLPFLVVFPYYAL